MSEARTARQVINQAIKENRGAKGLCYALVVGIAVTGLAVLVWGAWREQGGVALAGSVATGFFWPALSQARQIRQAEMAIRLLEIPLTRTDNAREAAEALREAFQTIFVKRSPQ